MNRTFSLLTKYLMYAFPFVVVAMIWSGQVDGTPDPLTSSRLERIAWEIFSWNLMIWFAGLILFLLLLLFRTANGDQLLKRLANLKERDEREAIITGNAAKSSFLATLALLIFLIGVSVLQVEVRTLPPSEIKADGHTKTLSIGADFRVWETPGARDAVSVNAMLVKHGLPLTKLGILVVILFWHLTTFFCRARRDMRA